MKTILGLDLGTNSIGWALVNSDEQKIMGMGSRIIPMTQDVLDIFTGGKPLETQTAARTNYRSARRLLERFLQRRERLHRVLKVLGFLPEHYSLQIDFERSLGHFYANREPKLAWKQALDGPCKFIFQESFQEMVTLFLSKGYEKKVPYDWTIYYLRKKALTQKIEKEELAWILLNFNQKRGYYQLRGEEEEDNPYKLVEYHSLKIIDVKADEKPNSKGETWYSLELENGWIYRRSSKISLNDWKGKTRDFIVTTDLNDDGTIKKDKEGIDRRSFRAPNENDWTLLKKKTEVEIDHSHKYVGEYIFEALLDNPVQKIRGKLVRTIERKYYKEEIIAILKKQIELQPELFTEEKYNDCIRELYKSNKEHSFILSKRNFIHLLVEDILFYQRPLRSQKSAINNCTLEKRIYKDRETGKSIETGIKTISKSHPLYQEFRIWQWLYNLKIYSKADDKDLTATLIENIDDKVKLFEYLHNRKDIEQKPLIEFLIKSKRLKAIYKSDALRWNYVEDKKYPCNETGTMIRTRLEKANVPIDFLSKEKEKALWHIIYSVTDKIEFEKALNTFAEKNKLNDKDAFVESFRKFPPFKSEYGQFSEKAIIKMLSLMRLGKYWNWENINSKTKERISKLMTGEWDENIRDRVREKALNLRNEVDFQGLPLWLAQYIIYDRHSEAEILGKWQSVADLQQYLDEFKQHSLRNPIVEQVITETLRVIKDIWEQFGNGAPDFFSEIHVELGREMKNTAEDRKKLTNIVTENENTNLRIKALLTELQNNTDGKLQVDDVKPYSPIQQDILKIYEEGVLNSGIPIEDDIKKISKTGTPTQSELQRYKLWLEQKYCSPYTGKAIPLGKLFTKEYEIEHIIPKSRYYDDGFNNKVICEAAVNREKDKFLGMEFIKKCHGKIIEIGFGKTVRVLEVAEYETFIKEHYPNNRTKRNNLLLEDIPEKMIERQMNDTRYISKVIFSLLSNLVRENKDDDSFNSKNVVPCNGKITTTLKQDWGLNDIWNQIILPRFERMNKITKTESFTTYNEHQTKLPAIPLVLSKGYQKKRLDHRHHAMDALVIACATRDHVNLLNNKHANTDNVRYDLQYKLRLTEPWLDKNGKNQAKFTEFKKPWNTFTVDTRKALQNIIVSFKQNQRVINKATNHYTKYQDGKKIEIGQQGINWAIRKPLHKESVYAKVSLRKIKLIKLNEALKDWKTIVDKSLKKEIHNLSVRYGKFDSEVINKYFKDMKYLFNDVDISKVEVYYFDDNNAAIRKSLDTSFNEKYIRESVTDTGIQKILLNYLSTKENNPGIAFTPEGIEELNKDIAKYNDGHHHQPILKVRVYESLGNKFPVGNRGNRKDKYVEAAKGTNLFFAIYVDETGKRSFETVPLNIVLERLKQGLSEVPEKNEKDHKLLFFLSPNDLVYVPTVEENETGQAIHNCSLNEEQQKRIYKMVSCTGNQCMFIPHNVATSIVNKLEFSPLNKMERAITIEKDKGEMIKDVCIKLKVNRLGKITNLIG